MASVQKRGQSPGHVGESGIFELGGPLPGDEQALESLPSGTLSLPSQTDAASLPSQTDAARFDPMLQAFAEVRSLNTQLRGANDALHAVNETLRTKVEQLRITALDLEQVIAGLDVGIVLLDSALGLRHFNAMAAHFLALQAPDLGGSIRATCRGLGPQLAEWCREVLRSGQRIRRTFESGIGEPLTLQVRRTTVDGELRLILVFAETTGSQ
ncbi:MAG: hypothetical protein ABI895_02485 [Deltaproteobacteria bacterium]